MPQDHPDAGALPVKTAPATAGEVQTLYKHLGAEGQSRATLITPASGKKVRMIAVCTIWWGSGQAQYSVWFGTGTFASDASKAIYLSLLDSSLGPLMHSLVWPDGGGPVGEVDEVVSCRSPIEGSSSTVYMVQWREE